MTMMLRAEDWIPADGIALEPNADTAVRSHQNMLIVAGPGAGKTELLAQRACFLLQTNCCKSPHRILAISFKKDAAANLAERVEKRCGRVLSQRFDSYTFDAFAKSLLDRFANALPDNYKPSRNYEIITPNVDDFQKQLMGLSLPPEWDNRSIQEVSPRILSSHYCSQSLPLQNCNTLEQWAIHAIWTEWLNNSDASRLTFQMISRLAEYLLRQNPMIVKALQISYSHVFLDEFQDTTNIQYDLLKSAFLSSTATITAVGDDKQRIMGWAGALPNIFNLYCTEFRAQKTALTLNHRSAPLLVAIQAALAAQLDPALTESFPTQQWQPGEGLCEIHVFADHIQEAEYIATQIDEWISCDNLDPRRIAILAKQQVDTYAQELIVQLKRVGQKSRVESEMQDLLAEPLVQMLLHFFKLATAEQSPEDWQVVVDLLLDLNGCQHAENDEKCIELERQLDNMVQNLHARLSGIARTICSPESVEEILCQIVNFLGENFLKNKFPQYKSGVWYNSLLKNVAKIMAAKFQISGEWSTALDDFIGKDTIPIMTIHKSKGLEYDVVIFIGLEDGAFWNFRQQQHEDTCAFFVALSRAKLKVFFTFCNVRRTRRGNNSQSRQNIISLYDVLTSAGVEVISH
jgi:superfamily I DNA/RNA helicase